MEAIQCPICLSNYDNRLHVPMIGTCGHTVCDVCLPAIRSSCPMRCPGATFTNAKRNFLAIDLITMVEENFKKIRLYEKEIDAIFAASPVREIVEPIPPQQTNPFHTAFCTLPAPSRATYSIENPKQTHGFAVGDRISYAYENAMHQGTIRFIGRLRGRRSMYAGIQFDEPIGKGTGVYMGKQVFQTERRYAAFVTLNNLKLAAVSQV